MTITIEFKIKLIFYLLNYVFFTMSHKSELFLKTYIILSLTNPKKLKLYMTRRKRLISLLNRYCLSLFLRLRLFLIFSWLKPIRRLTLENTTFVFWNYDKKNNIMCTSCFMKDTLHKWKSFAFPLRIHFFYQRKSIFGIFLGQVNSYLLIHAYYYNPRKPVNKMMHLIGMVRELQRELLCNREIIAVKKFV